MSGESYGLWLVYLLSLGTSKMLGMTWQLYEQNKGKDKAKVAGPRRRWRKKSGGSENRGGGGGKRRWDICCFCYWKGTRDHQDPLGITYSLVRSDSYVFLLTEYELGCFKQMFWLSLQKFWPKIYHPRHQILWSTVS